MNAIEDALGVMSREYAQWNKDNGLSLGSADEHYHDASLTEQQIAWVRHFSDRWERVSRGETWLAYVGNAGDTAESLLRECLGLMEAVVEPCDHSVGSCWCDWHRVMDRAYATLPVVGNYS